MLRLTFLLLAESWAAKGQFLKRIDIKGRGRQGVKHHPQARLQVVLKEGKTREELVKMARAKKIKKVVSAGFLREHTPIRNPAPVWGW